MAALPAGNAWVCVGSPLLANAENPVP